MTWLDIIATIVLFFAIMIPVVKSGRRMAEWKREAANPIDKQLFGKLCDKYPYMSDKDINKMVDTTLRIKSNHLESDGYNNKEDSYADL